MPDAAPNVYAYVRVSTNEQTVASLDAQEAAARKRCDSFDGNFVCSFREVASASKIPWDKRPEFLRMLNTVQAGDHLIVWHLNRIDRSWEIINALKTLQDMGVIVHSVESIAGMQLPPLDTIMGKIVVMIFMIAATLETENKSQNTKSGIKFRKDNGYAWRNFPEPGKRREILDKLPSQGKPLKKDVWDDYQCQLLREIVYRHDVKRESLKEIAEDFLRRGEKDGAGVRLARMRGFSDKSRLPEVDSKKVAKGYRFYKVQETIALAMGEDMNRQPFVGPEVERPN